MGVGSKGGGGGGDGPKIFDFGAREAELTATLATLKGSFDGQKGKIYGHRDQRDRYKGSFTSTQHHR